ncbi:hypothetical protein [Pseudonocardia cypriaca]|uniref:Small secreted domain DUF320 n=1 Tax=Pseudonocardia cypriaca TaxID=882449 RepID=A0A543GBK3_9PSEU|nr:hypothetical protein [Pseudonocardia cypriaca]TQM43456.1 hypothetical protein FB388_0802 [Pseudonocardia cypriaca]
MLKKAGIIVATAAAGLLAVSPLAFAGDDHGSKIDGVSSVDQSNEGLINLAGNNVAVPVNVCDNQVPINVLGVQVPLNGTHVLLDLTGAAGLGLLGSSDTDADSGDSDDESGDESDNDNTIDDSCTAAAESGDSASIDD